MKYLGLTFVFALLILSSCGSPADKDSKQQDDSEKQETKTDKPKNPQQKIEPADAIIPHLSQVDKDINFIHIPQLGKYSGKLLVSFGRDAQTYPNSICIVDPASLKVEKAMQIPTSSGSFYEPDELMTNKQGHVFVQDTRNMGRVYRSTDEGASWTRLNSNGSKNSVKFKPIPKSAMSGSRGFADYVTHMAVNMDGDLIIVSAYSKSALAIIDPETGAGEFSEKLGEAFPFTSLDHLAVDQQGNIYLNGSLTEERNGLAHVVLKSADTGKTYTEISQGKLLYRGVTFKHILFYDDENNEYQLDGGKIGSALQYHRFRRNNNFSICPNNVIAKVDNPSFHYSEDLGESLMWVLNHEQTTYPVGEWYYY